MASAEQQEMLARISQLKGQIQQKKSQQSHSNSDSYAPNDTYGGMEGVTQLTGNNTYQQGYQAPSTSWGPNRGGYHSRGYSRGGRAPLHRNRTLVLNGNMMPGAGDSEASGNEDSNAKNSAPAWVVKHDRHHQIINPAVYEKESQKRAHALELTRQQKLKQRDEREKKRFMANLQRLGGSNYSGSSTPASGNHEVEVNGIRFRVAKGGSKLVKVPGEDWPQATGEQHGRSVINLQCAGDLIAAKSTPKSAVIGGVRFHRSKSGNMYRAGIIKALRRTRGIKKINEPCQTFSTTGSCHKGPRCRYIHDPKKVAVCKDFLQKGSCPSGDSCDLSHELTPERTPACLHFAKGNCSKPSCAYTHIRVSPTAPVCRAFGRYGYCEKGATCTERHVNECPDFSNTGTCTTKGCKLLHRYKASVMRNNNRSEEHSPEENSDISSDEEEEIGSDDVDSDDLDEEFFGDDDGKIDLDSLRQDYVHLA